MLRPIPEADWKTFRRLQPLALDRFCQRVLEEAERVATDTGQSHHERYLALYRLIQERNEELADSFDNPRRSTALMQLTRIYSDGLLTEEEWARFGEETRGRVEWLVRAWGT